MPRLVKKAKTLLASILYSLPCIVALLWFVTFIFRVKTQRQKLFMWTLGACVFYFATYSVYIFPEADYYTMVRLDCVCAPLIVCILALSVLYLSMHRTKVRKLSNWKFLILLPALVYAAVYFLLYYLLGFERAAYINKVMDETGTLPGDINPDLTNMYHIFGETLLDVYCFIMSMVMLWQCISISRNDGYKLGDAYRFFFKGAQTTQSRAISLLFITTIMLLMPMIIFGRAYMMNNPLIGATLTVLIAITFHFLCHVEFFGENTIVTLHELSHIQSAETLTNIVTGTPEVEEPVAVNVQEEKTQAAVAETSIPVTVQEEVRKEELVAVAEETTAQNENPQTATSAADSQTEMETMTEKAHVSMTKFGVLAQRLDELMITEHLYREENLTLAFLSERLGVGRTMISTMINNVYGTSFRDLVSKYRVEAAKKYMLANPNATQEAVAFECGFKDASSLNHKFKDCEGVTPLMWLTSQVK